MQTLSKMSPRGNVVAALGVVILLAAAAGIAWYGLQWPGLVSGRQSSAPRKPDRSAMNDMTVYLMPVTTGEIADRRPGEEVWEGLLPGIAADAESRKLLSRLYGNASAEFIVGPVDPRAEVLPPSNGVAVSVQVDIRRFEDKFSTRKGHVAGHMDLCRTSTVQFHPANFHAPAGTPPEDVFGAAFSAALLAQPNDLEVILLVANDYLLRKQPGWQIYSHGFSADAVQLPTGGPAELRPELDRQIEDYLKRHTVSADLGGPKE